MKLRLFIVICSLMLLAGMVVRIHAACPAVKSVKQVQAVQAIQYQQYAAAVLVPLYGAGYHPQQQNLATDQQTADLLRQLIEEIRALRNEIKNGQQAEKVLPPTPAALNGQAIVEQSCIKCHQTATADKQGGGFVIVEAGEADKDGKLSPLSLEQKRRVTNRVLVAKNMPPGGKLSDAERKAAVDFLIASREK